MSETRNNDHDNNNSTGSGFSTFLTGAVIGAALTYLFTTESGQKIKDELLKEGTKLLENFGDEIDKAKEKLDYTKDELIEEVGQKKKEIEAEIHSAAHDVKKGTKSVQDNIESVVEEIPEHVEEIQKKGRRFFFSKKSHSQES